MPSYEKNKSSGLWSVRFRESIPNDGIHQKRLSGFKTKKEAQYGYEDYISKQQKKLEEEVQNKVIEQSPNDMSFSFLVNAYLNFKQNRIKNTSYYDTVKKINKRILPFFFEMKIKEITPAKVVEWQNTISDFSYKYQLNLTNCLISIFNFGEKYYDITNIMKKVDKPRNLEPKKEMQFWTPEEFSKFIEKVEKEPYKQLFKFLFISGCRRGEAAALAWNDFDFKSHTVKISKNVSYKIGENGKSYHITTPKNFGSNRTIALPAFYCEELKKYKLWQSEHFECTDFVFGSTDPLPPSNIDRELKAAAKSADLKIIRVHDLRHSCASYLIHKGISIVAVSHRLGHNNVEQTLNTYSHMLPDDQTMIIRGLDELSTFI